MFSTSNIVLHSAQSDLLYFISFLNMVLKSLEKSHVSYETVFFWIFKFQTTTKKKKKIMYIYLSTLKPETNIKNHIVYV